ncbi:hypothetical protein FNF29_00281 [Cafeteria roenbergensis]|uniref:Major facilitator superfamily (MFS) profile domain-containing protein n=1 Tax=Cafeteria roenbergensis TaxID=33653 RepID=A0A5A8CKI2_CAFRO|nr:hypothetical protein FNF31_06459 [Cafeteria roenbergensis]KAA0157707.1 hypothetical protein FNF29_00281 [Cafeteria roenbergensis]|eukprot:KAA0157707.1 hypothetical protein FNF29_00281 [Cafeteria roenbergensis]
MASSLLDMPIDEVGGYAGILGAAFMAGRVLTSTLWGWLSDRIGRKPVILIGTLLCVVVNILFSISSSFAMAVTLRVVTGVVNGVVGVNKAVTGEIVTSPKQQAVAMTFLTAGWSLGLVLGPALGGLLLGVGPVGEEYPFMPPALVVAVIGALAVVAVWFLLPETLSQHAPLPRGLRWMSRTPAVASSSAGSGDAAVPSDSVPLSGAPASQAGSDTALEDSGIELTDASGSAELVPRGEDGGAAPARAAAPGSAASVAASEGAEGSQDALASRSAALAAAPPGRPADPARIAELEAEAEGRADEAAAADGRRWMLCRRHVGKVIGIYTLYSCGTILVDEVFPLWAQAQPVHGGLGLSAADVGTVLAASGAAMVVLQLTVCQLVMRRLPTRTLFWVGAAIQVPLVLVAPLVSGLALGPGVTPQPVVPGSPIPTEEVPGVTVAWDRPAVMAAAIAMVFLRLSAAIVSFTACAVLVNSSVPDGERGAVNGVAMATASVGKAVGPAVGGAVLAWALATTASAWPPFIVGAVLNAVVAVLAWTLPEELSLPYAMREKDAKLARQRQARAQAEDEAQADEQLTDARA